jgi:hypothetical protein
MAIVDFIGFAAEKVEIMFSADQYVLEFIKENFVSLGILIGFLKVLAQRSKTTLDDSILGYFGGVIGPKKRSDNETEE